MKVFDLHCDTLSELRYAEEAGQPKSFAENDLQIDLIKLQKGDYMLQCFAAFVNLARPGQDPQEAALEEIDIFKRIMAKYSDILAPVYQPEDLRKNAEAGKISGMLTIEEACCCKGRLGGLRDRHLHEIVHRLFRLRHIARHRLHGRIHLRSGHSGSGSGRHHTRSRTRRHHAGTRSRRHHARARSGRHHRLRVHDIHRL